MGSILEKRDGIHALFCSPSPPLPVWECLSAGKLVRFALFMLRRVHVATQNGFVCSSLTNKQTHRLCPCFQRDGRDWEHHAEEGCRAGAHGRGARHRGAAEVRRSVRPLTPGVCKSIRLIYITGSICVDLVALQTDDLICIIVTPHLGVK